MFVAAVQQPTSPISAPKLNTKAFLKYNFQQNQCCEIKMRLRNSLCLLLLLLEYQHHCATVINCPVLLLCVRRVCFPSFARAHSVNGFSIVELARI